jgi:hypothetical protein
MMRNLRERFIWHLTSLTLADDAYGRNILGDLLEGRALVAQTSGDREAARWFRREAVRSWLAFIPMVQRRPRDIAIAASIASLAYAGSVNGAGPLAIQIGNWLRVANELRFDALYLVVVALIAFAAGVSTFATRRGNPAGAVTFFALAIAFGTHHLVVSNRNELVFRAMRVIIFIAFAAIGSASAILARRAPHGEPR